MFLKFGRVWVSAPQEGAGGMRGGDFGFFGEGGFHKINTNMVKSFYERF